MSRITKSKFYKPFISLLVAVLLVFTYEVNKPKAIVPIVIWGAGILAGVVAEELLEMGIKHVTTDGKSTKKSKTKKIADEILDSLDGYDFDNTNPTRKADGSLEVNMSANDRAKIARKIADEFGDVITADDDRRTSTTNPRYETSFPQGDQFYNTSIGINISPADPTQPHSVKAVDFITSLMDVRYTPKSFEQSTQVDIYSSLTGTNMASFVVEGGYTYSFKPKDFNYTSTSSYISSAVACNYWFLSGDSDAYISKYSDYGICDAPTVNYYINYMKVSEMNGSRIHTSGGVVVPSTLKNVYPVGEGYNGDLPNKTQLSNKPYKIKNFFPSSDSDEDVSWELVQNHYDTDVVNNQTKIDNEYETYLENGDLNKITNTYNTQTINNYYTDTTYPVKSEDIRIDIDIDITTPPPVVIDDDDDGSTGDLPPQAEVLDRTLISYAKQTYDYLGDSIDGAITSMRDITDDASGLVDYLDTSFRWLPAEWRALFGSAFILGVFAHFMRR